VTLTSSAQQEIEKRGILTASKHLENIPFHERKGVFTEGKGMERGGPHLETFESREKKVKGNSMIWCPAQFSVAKKMEHSTRTHGTIKDITCLGT